MKNFIAYLQFCYVVCAVLFANPAHAWKMEAGKLSLTSTSSLSQMQQHTFQQIYDTPPVVIALTTSAGSHASSIRIADVTTTGFRMSPVEPRSHDGPHAAMSVSYIAIEPGRHTFPNGEVIEAGRLTTDRTQFNGQPNGGKRWETLTFSSAFTAPVVLADIQTTRNETDTIPRRPSHPWLTVAVQGISNTQASVALERSEVFDRRSGPNYQFDALSATEDIGYVVMSRNLRGNFRASGNVLVNFESLYSQNILDGWSDGCDNVNFAGSYSSAPIVVASKSSRNEVDGGWLRECSVNSSRIQLTIDEDTSQDSERNHAREDASLLVFSRSFFYDSNAPTTLNTASALMLESGSVTLSPTSFTTIQLKQVYEYPPAVFLLEDNQNPEPSSVRIRNVTEQSFQVIPVEPDSRVADATDQATTIHYLVASKGQFTFPDGKKIEVGPVVPPDQITNFQSKRFSGSSWYNFSFASSFSSTPAFLSFTQSMNSETGHTPGAPSQPWMTTTTRNLTSRGGDIALDRAETNTGSITAPEKIAFLATEPGIIRSFKDNSGRSISGEAQVTPDSVAGTVSCNQYNFLQSYANPPLVTGSQMTRDGADGGWLRRCSTSNGNVRLKIEEDWALDTDRSHTTERAGFLAFSEAFDVDFSLVANYQLEGPSWPHTAGDVIDSSNSGLHGQSFGDARPFPAQVCNGALLDGNRDYIEVPHSPVLNIRDELTVMAWIKPDSLPGSGLKTIVSKDTNFEFHVDSSGRIVWWWNNASGSARTFHSNASRVTAGNWHHVAITYSKKAGSQRIYVNGIEANRQTYANESLINNSLPMFIGTDYNYPSRDFAGSIDEVKVFTRALPAAAIQKFAAESRACSSCTLGRFDITQPAYSLACPDTRAEIEITARCVDGSIKTDYTGTVNLSGPSGSSFYSAAAAGSPISSISYALSDSGVKKTYLYFNNEQSDVRVTAQDTAAVVSSTAATGTQFNAFGFYTRTQPDNFICGNSTTMDLLAYGKVDNLPGGSCAVLTGFNGNKTLDAWFSADLNNDATQDVVSNAINVAGTSVSAQTSAANNNLSLNFVNGEASFTLRYPNAAKIQNLNFRYDSAPYDGSQYNAMQSSSNAFIVRPDRFQLSASSGGNPLTGSSSSAATTHKAGQTFDLSITAQCTDGSIATDYLPNSSNNTLMAYLQRTGPLGASSVNGEMTLAASKVLTSDPSATLAWASANISPGSFSAGSYKYAGARYSEVGLTRLFIQDQDYYGEQVPQASLDIGRFIPDHFEVTTQSGSLAAYCSPGSAPPFSYIGQAITYDALPEVLIEARNAQNTVTQNYTESGYLKLQPVDVRRFFPSEDRTQFGSDGSTKLLLNASALVPAAFSSATAGLIRYTFVNTDTFTYTRNSNAVIGPFNSDLQVIITNIEDSDNVGSNAEPYDILPAPIQLRYARWVMDNAFGPETQNLGIPMRIEHWSGTSFAVNSGDTCSSYNASNLSLSPALSGGTTAASGSGTLASGEVPVTAQISLSAPGAGNTGRVNLEYLVDSWLTYDWDNNPATPDTNPTAAAEFGQYRGHDRIIYWREVQN